LNTQRKYSSSVRVFFPKFSREDVIKELNRCIKENRESLGLYKVLLFGSYARGDYTVSSDIDVFVVFDDEKINGDRVYKTLMKAIKLPRIELHVTSKKEYEVLRSSKWIRTTEEDGIKILDAP
jgi:predicted nucleotidyltransferase